MRWNPEAQANHAEQSQSMVGWTYEEAFARHEGLLNSAEQGRLRRSRVAVAGLGGVGGIHLATLARLGIGSFTIADPDTFEVANINRQFGAGVQTLGRNKTEIMSDLAQGINPEVNLEIFNEGINEGNIGDFLEGADVVVDGIDFFAMDARRLLFREARKRGKWVVTAGPLGFSTAWIAFSPDGISFDEYFDIHDPMDYWEQIISFAVGLTPKATHLAYTNLKGVNPRSTSGPSAALACHLCSGVVATKVIKILLNRKPLRAAPHFFQFDAYRGILRQGKLRWGNRHPLQRLKRWYLKRQVGK
jgi:molybdopterin/thiamine biosynthesis adenylyltransferase